MLHAGWAQSQAGERGGRHHAYPQLIDEDADAWRG